MMTEQPDPAAVFGGALSLRSACLKRADDDSQLNLSECYNGMDEFMRQMMHVATLFEDWSCAHVVFRELDDVWPYLMEDRGGGGGVRTRIALIPTNPCSSVKSVSHGWRSHSDRG